MPRRNRSGNIQIPAIRVPGFKPERSPEYRVHEKIADPHTFKYDKFGVPRTREEYLRTGIGRELTEQSRELLISLLGIRVRPISNSGIPYIHGSDLAGRVNFGMNSSPRQSPREAAITAFEEKINATELCVQTERETLLIQCLGFGVKRFGTDTIKIHANLSDIEDESGDTVVLGERIRLMQAFGIKEVPTMKDILSTQHRADLGLTDEYSFEIASRIILPISRNLSGIEVELLPVGPIQTVLPIY